MIVTSYVFRDGQIDFERLEKLKTLVGKDHLVHSSRCLARLLYTDATCLQVLDLSCRKKAEDGRFYVMTDRWQTFTSTSIEYVCILLPLSSGANVTDCCRSEALLHRLADYCDEFLVHAVDVEGKRCGIQVRGQQGDGIQNCFASKTDYRFCQ